MRISVIDLKSCAQFATTFDKGREYYRNGYVSLRRHSATQLTADVRGNSGMFYHVDISLSHDTNFGKLIINRWNCTCPAHASYPDGYCKHVIATALAYNDAPVSSAPAAAPAPVAITDASLRRLLLQRAAEPRVNAQNSKVHLETTLEVFNEYCRLSFRLGYKRLYVVKNLNEFVNLIHENGEYRYGQSLTFVHSVNGFCEEDRPIVQFILDEFDFENNARTLRPFSYQSELQRYIYLRPSQLDRLMAMWPYKTMRITEGASCATLPVVRENLMLNTTLVEQHDGQYSLNISGHFRHFDGMRGSLVISGGLVYFCDEHFSRSVLPLITASTPSHGRLLLSEEHMPLFASVLLPDLERNTSFTTLVDLTRYESEPLKAALFIDLDGAVVKAKLVFVYGDISYDAFGENSVGEGHVGDYIAEECARQVVCECFSDSELVGNAFVRTFDDDFVFEFATVWYDRLQPHMQIFCDDSLRTVTIRRPEKISIGLHLDCDLLMMEVSLGDEERGELAGILASLSARKKYFRMKDGSFLSLEGNSLSELGDIADGLGLSSKDITADRITLPAYRAMYLDTAIKESHSIDYVRSSSFRQLIRDLRDVADSDFELPNNLRGTMRSYQVTGYRWMRTLAAHSFGGILADDMGLGKTLQVLSVLSATQGSGRSIVVCPSSLVLNWVSEAHKFVPSLDVIAVTGSAQLREEIILEHSLDCDLLVTSYDSLKRDIDLYSGFEFEYIIADEAQYMKNYATQNARAVKALSGKHRFALTGTPVENTLAELWSIFDFILPGYLFNYTHFKNNFEQPIVKDGDDLSAQNLRRLTAPFILRRLKRDVLTELPDKTETLLEAAMDSAQEKVYRANAAMVRDELLSQIAGGIHGRIQILSQLTRLRQLCCDPSLIYDNYEGESAKLELCMELIEQCIAGGHKLLLFSQFTSMLAIIEQRLRAAGIRYYILTGKTKPSDRLGMVDGFNSDDTPVFLISLKAGGTGLNLTGADVVIHYDPWWNISAQNQATDRAHRIGQKKNLQIYKLILKDTIEQRILALQQSKAELVDKIIEADSDALASISDEELLSLLS